MTHTFLFKIIFKINNNLTTRLLTQLDKDYCNKENFPYAGERLFLRILYEKGYKVIMRPGKGGIVRYIYKNDENTRA